MRKHLRALLAVPALALLLQGSAVAIPDIAIVTPEDGSTVSRGQTQSLNVTGLAGFETPEPSDTRFNLRRDGCGDGEVRYLHTATGADNDTCRWPQWTILGTVDEEGFAEDFPATDGVPLTLDASRSIMVRLVFESEIVGAGLATVRARLNGTTASFQTVSLGDESSDYVVSPAQASYPHTFTFEPPASMDKQDLTGLELVVSMSGAAANHGVLKLRGQSYVDMPTYTASFDRRVETGVDNGPFSSTGVTLSEDFTSFSRTIATPLPGTRTIKARARQGTQVSPTHTVTITVTE
jgi:hypothetical protein